MRARELLGLPFLVVSLAACATGTQLGGAGGGDTSTSEAGSGGTTTSSVAMCSEAPCKLLAPQCGCAADEMCALDVNAARVCHAKGDVQRGEVCTDLYACAPGALCVQTSSTTSICTSYCDDDAQCGGGQCLIQLTDPNNSSGVIPGVTLCTDNCDPVSAQGCPTGVSVGCQLYQEQDGAMRTFTLCAGAGNKGQGSTCTASEECQIGFACFTLSDMSKECLRYCNFNDPSCPAGTICQDLGLAYNGVEYGACL